ncbi:GNAT family N-acetyltransferase [uncultured Roseobacter sp.]|uniref:GNAT family N-acetyltransferase n=1 Tax=uncultured Roseobacter sp. TaxID=114847 RepID=UPI0026321B02|nr:GNAT family N-acetyltransferase [uncultured Roseobacter sp.]
MQVMFDAAPASDPSPLQQSDAFARALNALGTPPLRLEDGTLALHRKIGPLPVHMITRPGAETPETLRDLARGMKVRGPVLLAPERPMPLNRIGALPLVSPSTIARLDVTPDETTLFAGLHQKWRNRLRHAQSQKLRVTRQNMPDDPGHWMLQADLVQRHQRGYRSWPLALTLAYGRANPGQAKLFTAFWGREPVAALLILRHGTGATYHIGHTRASGRLTSAHTLLLWSAIRWARSKGVQQLELGTFDTEENAGLARFKLGTGALPHRLGGTWLWWPPLTSLLRPLARLDRRLMQSG